MYLFIHVVWYGSLAGLPGRALARGATGLPGCAANLRAEILDSRGFDASIIKMLRGGILMSTGDFLESLGQRILEG